ncbi:MAG: ADOP family duplicated permease [Gemmatimonadetes bacterium]|nr:ADOP family duplicated permease [Gemmatimonadota bacterium]
MRVKLKRERLIRALSQSHLSQNHWAQKLGFSRGHFSEILNGKHPFVSPQTREKLLGGLGIPFDELFDVEAGDEWTHETSANFQAAIVDRYLIDHELGHGGMGTVYLARDVKHGRQVAIKVISPEAVSGIGTRQFLKEIRYASRLEHPNILSLHDSGEAAGYPFYIMPHIRGGSLKEYLKSKGRLSFQETVRIAADIAAALQYAHENRVIHCDIKPANILLAPNHAYVADFGISRALHAEVREWGRRVGVDSSAGTPAYVSPEQASGETEIGGRADTYSLGCVIYEMLTGRPPFTGSTTMEIVSKRFTTAVPNVRDVVPSVPLGVAAVVERSMATEVRRRPGSAQEFLDDLERAAKRYNPLVEGVTLGWARLLTTVRKITGRTLSYERHHWKRKAWSMDRLIDNVRFALRSLRKRPGFATVAVLTLALGVGANSAIFSVVNGIFFRKPQLTEPQRLVEISRLYPGNDFFLISHRDIEDLRTGAGELFSGVAAVKPFTGQVGREGVGGDVVAGMLVSANYFGVLGVQPFLGRWLVPGEDLTPETHPVIVLAHRYWTTRFGGDPSVVGRSIRLNGRMYDVVGVASESFPGRVPAFKPDLWVAMMMENHLFPSGRDANNLAGVARLRPGVTIGQVEAALSTLAARIDEERGRTNRRWEFTAVSHDEITAYAGLDGPLSAIASLLLTVVAVVLLITCTNLAGFLLARATDRRKEIAVRLALGATRATLVGQLLTEALLLGALGGVAGLVLAVWVVRLLVGLEPPLPFPINLDVSLDVRVLGYTMAVAIVAGVLFGLAPALQSTRPDLARTLRDEAGAVVGPTRRFNLRNGLIVAQMAMSLLLLVGAGLFIRSFQRALDVDVGFSTDPAAILTVDARGSGYEEEEWPILYRRLLEGAQGIPGARQVAVTTRLPLALGISNTGVEVPGVETSTGGTRFNLDVAWVSPAYFATLGIGIEQGRAFTGTDREGSQRVAILSAPAVARFWPGEDPIGRVIRRGGEDIVVVGVASSAKIRSLNEAPRRYLYLPIEQQAPSLMRLVVKGAAPAHELLDGLRAVAFGIDPNLFVAQAYTMADHLGVMYYLPRMAALFLLVFAALALVLACVGLYGVVSYGVARRTREMGIRISLGAQAPEVVRLVMRGGLGLVLVGGAIGVVVALAVTRVLEGFLVGVSGTDLPTFVAVPLVLIGVAMVAAYLPARRASRVNPTDALRAE